MLGSNLQSRPRLTLHKVALDWGQPKLLYVQPISTKSKPSWIIWLLFFFSEYSFGEIFWIFFILAKQIFDKNFFSKNFFSVKIVLQNFFGKTF